ncbi:hypothetical protein ACTMJH_23315, partial [Escherichia coli]
FRPVSIFGLLPITVFINSSHVLTLLTSLALLPHDACSKVKPLIRSVPALVVFCSHGYDIIRGNLRVGQALEKVAATGDCRQVAHDLLAGKGDSGK